MPRIAAVMAAAVTAMAVSAFTLCASAQYADPPDAPLVADPSAPPYPPYDYTPPNPPHTTQASTVRVMTGPAARFWDVEPAGGLFVGLEAGRGPAGARATATWIAVGHDRGMGQYTGELWVAFDLRPLRLRPSIAAGAGLVQLDEFATDRSTTERRELETRSVGVGVLRGGVAYLLPVRGTDARLALDVSGVVPAIRDPDSPDLAPWLLTSGSVVIGF